jgi:hypothetical protein
MRPHERGSEDVPKEVEELIARRAVIRDDYIVIRYAGGDVRDVAERLRLATEEAGRALMAAGLMGAKLMSPYDHLEAIDL